MAVALALMFVVPVGAVNVVSSASHDTPYRDYTMKYAPAPTTALPTTGDIRGTIRAHQNDISQQVIAYGPSGTIIAPILADGTFEFTNLTPGQYQLYIADGNGGQPEYSTATVVAGKVAFPEKDFLGHAISVGDGKVKVVILEALYGKIETRERIVTDAEAYDEYIPAVTHQDYEAGHVHAKKVSGHAPHDFIYNFQKYQITGSKHDTAFKVTNYFCARLANIVTIVDVPAHTVHHDAVTHVETYEVGSIVDVTEEVQAAVDAGYMNLKFDNAQNPGGLFSADNGALIKQIADPAVGIVKDVKIKLGSGVVIDTKEYEVINL